MQVPIGVQPVLLRALLVLVLLACSGSSQLVSSKRFERNQEPIDYTFKGTKANSVEAHVPSTRSRIDPGAKVEDNLMTRSAPSEVTRFQASANKTTSLEATTTTKPELQSNNSTKSSDWRILLIEFGRAPRRRHRRDDEPQQEPRVQQQHQQDPQVSASSPVGQQTADTVDSIPLETNRSHDVIANEAMAAADYSNQSQVVLELGVFEAAQMGFFRHPPLVSMILTIAYSMVFIIGLAGNSLVVLVVCKSPRMRTVTNYFIANLALADILVLVFCLPVTLLGNLFIRK